MIGIPAVLRPRWVRSARLAVLLAVFAVALAACSGGPSAANDPISTSFVGSTYLNPQHRPEAPSIAGRTLAGKRLSLAAYRGRVVVMNFWESYCGPCRAEAASLSALARHFAADAVQFVGDDENDAPAAAEGYEHTFNISYPSLSDPGGKVALAFHDAAPPSGVPSTLVIDRTGHIAAIVAGGVSYNSLKALIDRVLAEKVG